MKEEKCYCQLQISCNWFENTYIQALQQLLVNHGARKSVATTFNLVATRRNSNQRQGFWA